MNDYHALCMLPQMEKLPTDSKSLEDDFQRYLVHHLGRFQGCNPYFLYEALSLTVRDRVMANWRDTWVRHTKRGTRRGYYLSLEFLIGRSLGNHLLNLDIKDDVDQAMHSYALRLSDLMEE
ncbi:MAG: glycogen phosphorylase, partial [Gammaproteobacteria bacterium]|nr:glycogen phosphorylase [Gammaproteobacteria bacterium]